MKYLLKSSADVLAQIMTTPLWWWTRAFMSRTADPDRVFAWCSQLASAWTGPMGEYSRRALYGRLLDRCEADVCICYGTIFSRRGARLGHRVYVGAHCNLGLAELEDDVLLGSCVHILSGKRQHFYKRTDIPIREQGGEYQRVRVGKGSWLGNAAIVLADVGEGCIVGAGSVVTKSVPDGAIVGGNPAKVLGYREGFVPDEAAQSS